MTEYRLFSGVTGPAAPQSYGGNMITGIMFSLEGGGNWFEGYWYWVANSGQATTGIKCALWSVVNANNGKLVPGSVVTSGTLVAGQWNFIPLPEPIPLSPTFDPNYVQASGAYIAAFGVNGNFNDSQTGNYFASNNPFNGPLHTFLSGNGNGPWGMNVGSGVFTVAGSDPSVTMPNGGDNSNQFFVDVQVTNVAPENYTGTIYLWPNDGPGNNFVGGDAEVAYTGATEVDVTEACNAVSVKYLSPSGSTTLATIVSVWNVSTGQKVVTNTSPTWSGAAGSGWVETTIPTTELQPGNYRVSVYNANGLTDSWLAKDASSGYFDLGAGANGIDWGVIKAPNLANAQAGVLYNGTQAGGSPVAHAQAVFGMPPGETFPNQFAPVTAETDPSNTTHTQSYFVDLGVQLLAATPPTITTQPQSETVTVSVGGSTTLTVAATGTAPIVAQWQSSPDNSTWTNISGATALTYSPSTATVGTTHYRAVLTNPGGGATSNIATVTVIPATSIVTVTCAIGATCHYWFTPQGKLSTSGHGATVPSIVYGYVTENADGSNATLSVDLDGAYLWDVRLDFRNIPPVRFNGYAPANGDLLEQLSAQGWISL